MDAEKTRRLLDLLRDEYLDQQSGRDSADPLAALLREARDEALAEAKALLKQMLVQAILEHAIEPVGGNPGAPGSHQAPSNLANNAKAPVAAPVPVEQPAPATRDSAAPAEITDCTTEVTPPNPPSETEQVLSEIEAIRRKIAENEQLLKRVKTPPAPSAGSPNPADQPAAAAGAAPESAVDIPQVPVEQEGDRAVHGALPLDESLGYYAYAILSAGVAQPLGEVPPAGIDPAHPGYVLPYRDLQVVVSRVPLAEFDEGPLRERLDDLAWVEAKVRGHQAVLDVLLGQAALVPLRFCTIYRDEERIREMLAQEHETLLRLLARLEGRQEWGVKVFCANETLTPKVREVSPRVQQLDAEILTRSSGAAYFAKKKLEETIAEEVERLRDEYAQRSHDCLARLSVEALVTPLQSKEAAGREDEMVLNAAYLVEDERWHDFRAGLTALEEEYRALGLSYVLTGPWPPYNFCQGPDEGGNGGSNGTAR